jgi:hypothetical protein
MSPGPSTRFIPLVDREGPVAFKSLHIQILTPEEAERDLRYRQRLHRERYSIVDRPYHHGWVPADESDPIKKHLNGGYGWFCALYELILSASVQSGSIADRNNPIISLVFVVNVHTWGVNAVRPSNMIVRRFSRHHLLTRPNPSLEQSWGIFLGIFITSNTYPGVTKFEYGLVGGLSIAQALMISPLAVVCQKSFGPRPTMLAGSFAIFLGLLSASASSRIWHLVVSQGLFFGWGMGLLYVPVRHLRDFLRHQWRKAMAEY